MYKALSRQKEHSGYDDRTLSFALNIIMFWEIMLHTRAIQWVYNHMIIILCTITKL